MQIAQAIYGLGKGMLFVADLSVVGVYVSCTIRPGEPCLGGHFGESFSRSRRCRDWYCS